MYTSRAKRKKNQSKKKRNLYEPAPLLLQSRAGHSAHEALRLRVFYPQKRTAVLKGLIVKRNAPLRDSHPIRIIEDFFSYFPVAVVVHVELSLQKYDTQSRKRYYNTRVQQY